jgi:hypothetical protein
VADVQRTWDGLPVARERPDACCIVVWREVEGSREFLLLHRLAPSRRCRLRGRMGLDSAIRGASAGGSVGRRGRTGTRRGNRNHIAANASTGRRGLAGSRSLRGSSAAGHGGRARRRARPLRMAVARRRPPEMPTAGRPGRRVSFHPWPAARFPLVEGSGVPVPKQPQTRVAKPLPATFPNLPPNRRRTSWRFKSSHPHSQMTRLSREHATLREPNSPRSLGADLRERLVRHQSVRSSSLWARSPACPTFSTTT